jgi:uncharacterized Zn finger protein
MEDKIEHERYARKWVEGDANTSYCRKCMSRNVTVVRPLGASGIRSYFECKDCGAVHEILWEDTSDTIWLVKE